MYTAVQSYRTSEVAELLHTIFYFRVRILFEQCEGRGYSINFELDNLNRKYPKNCIFKNTDNLIICDEKKLMFLFHEKIILYWGFGMEWNCKKKNMYIVYLTIIVIN